MCLGGGVGRCRVVCQEMECKEVWGCVCRGGGVGRCRGVCV